MPFSRTLAPALLAFAICSAPLAASAQSFSDAQRGEIESIIKNYLVTHPEVLEEASAELSKRQVAAEAAKHANAVSANAQTIFNSPRGVTLGNQSGDVNFVEFFDYNCGYCKLAAPEILRIIEENPDVRVVFKELPIFGAASDTAARIALTDAGKANALALYKTWMAEKPLDEAGIDRHLTELGLNPAAVRKAAAAPAIDKQIEDIRQLAVALKIQGTPVFVIGDALIPGADMEAVRAAITQAKGGDIKPAAVAEGA